VLAGQSIVRSQAASVSRDRQAGIAGKLAAAYILHSLSDAQIASPNLSVSR
jgi:hypothetical protein